MPSMKPDAIVVSTRPTDIVEPPKHTYVEPVVKVELRVQGEDAYAHITTQDGRVDMPVAIETIAKRFRPGERVVYFKAKVKSHLGVLEIGERMEPKKPW